MKKVVKDVLVSLYNKSSPLLSHLRAINNFCSPYTMYIYLYLPCQSSFNCCLTLNLLYSNICILLKT